MKILMINVVCGIRSTGRICTDLARALEEQGHEVKIAYGRGTVPGQYEKYAVRIGNNIDVRLHGVQARLLDKAGFGSVQATRRFVRWIEEYDPDIIHLHNIHGYYINVEILFDYLRKCGKKIIWTLHDCWAFTGHSAYCNAVGCKRWMEGCSDCPQIHAYPKSYRDCSKKNWLRKKECFSNIPNMTIVTPSCWLADLVGKSYLKGADITTIHNGIDLSCFHSDDNLSMNNEAAKNKYGMSGKVVLLGVASVWDEYKGFDTFLKLAERLPEEFGIVLIGLSAKQIAKLPKPVLGIERTDSVEQLREIYSMADVFVNPTIEDNYPTTNMEAIACGTPVITYNTGGSGESVNEECGFVVGKSDLEQLMRVILEKKYLWLAKNREAFQKQAESFDKYIMLQKYLTIYEEDDTANE